MFFKNKSLKSGSFARVISVQELIIFLNCSGDCLCVAALIAPRRDVLPEKDIKSEFNILKGKMFIEASVSGARAEPKLPDIYIFSISFAESSAFDNSISMAVCIAESASCIWRISF